MAYNNNFRNTMQRTTPVVLNLIIINVLVFIAQVLFDGPYPQEKITRIIELYPYNSIFFKPYQLVTSMFAHGGFLHILLNMYALWLFGTILERIWGAKRFLIFYFACGLAAGVAHMLLANAPAVGASGAIMGLLAAFAYMYPNTEFYIIPIPFAIKAKYLVAIYAAYDIFGSIKNFDNIGHFAHLGGLVMGFILVIIWNKTNKKTFY
jgi:membrane associated rhomboid family serine protease